tara:strand:+ start:57 stop:335 length:279 start_codon:yes stop_codon:yes gene_type:complete
MGLINIIAAALIGFSGQMVHFDTTFVAPFYEDEEGTVVLYGTNDNYGFTCYGESSQMDLKVIEPHLGRVTIYGDLIYHRYLETQAIKVSKGP